MLIRKKKLVGIDKKT